MVDPFSTALIFLAKNFSGLPLAGWATGVGQVDSLPKSRFVCLASPFIQVCLCVVVLADCALSWLTGVAQLASFAMLGTSAAIP